MIIYNVTIKVDVDVHDEWISWMKSKHIPDVMNTGFFTAYKILRLMEDDSSDGITYAIQYSCLNISAYLNYKETAAPALQAEVNEKYKNKFVAFRTLLKEV